MPCKYLSLNNLQRHTTIPRGSSLECVGLAAASKASTSPPQFSRGTGSPLFCPLPQPRGSPFFPFPASNPRCEPSSSCTSPRACFLWHYPPSSRPRHPRTLPPTTPSLPAATTPWASPTKPPPITFASTKPAAPSKSPPTTPKTPPPATRFACTSPTSPSASPRVTSTSPCSSTTPPLLGRP